MHINEFLLKLTKVKPCGDGFTARCPGHDDTQNSLSISTGDDGRILLRCHAGCNTDEIIAPIDVTLRDLFPPRQTTATASVVAQYDYHDEAGQLVFQVQRMNPKSFRQRRPDGDGGWKWDLKGVIKPIYRLPQVKEAIAKKRVIFYVEGEKDVHTLESYGLVATTHAGGAAAWATRYKQYLQGADIIVLPDNDPAGRELADKIKTDIPDALVVDLPGLPPKGDVTDWFTSGGTLGTLKSTVAAAMRARDENPPPAPVTPELDSKYFRVLGHSQGLFYFLPRESRQIVSLRARDLTCKATLYALAPRDYWEMSSEYHTPDGKNTDYNLIADALIRRCYARGVYTDEHRRGRGAWFDEGRTVLHQGDRLIVDGKQTDLIDFQTGYVYEARSKMFLPFANPATDEETTAFAELCGLPAWEAPIHAMMLAGWVACAPICGTLQWRPHIWIVGPAGCGKTYVTNRMVATILQGTARLVAASTTEAGIRQLLGSDSLPVLFDEAEGDNKRGQEDIQRILELMRQASADSSAAIVKGSASGHAQEYRIRSMFCLSSIAHGLARRADESRTTVLTLKKPTGQKAFQKITSQVAEICTPAFAAGFVARSCQLAAVIRKNADTFAEALACTEGGRRYGDQVGALLAGYHSLFNAHVWTLAEANSFVRDMELDALAPTERGHDEEQCLLFLLEQRVKHESRTGIVDRTIGELIEAVFRGLRIESEEHATLKRYGIRVIEGFRHVAISNTNDGLRQVFAGSPYGVQWAIYLRRLEGAEVGVKAMKFAGNASRYTSVPRYHFE